MQCEGLLTQQYFVEKTNSKLCGQYENVSKLSLAIDIVNKEALLQSEHKITTNMEETLRHNCETHLLSLSLS